MTICQLNLSKYGCELTVLEHYLRCKCLHEKYVFYEISVDEVKDELCLSYKQQTRLLDKLQSLSVIEIKRFGLPAKRHIRIIGDL